MGVEFLLHLFFFISLNRASTDTLIILHIVQCMLSFFVHFMHKKGYGDFRL